MKAYLDSSAILRKLLGEPGALEELEEVTLGITSQVSRLECFRTFDRLIGHAAISSEEFAGLRALCIRLMSKLEIIPLSEQVISLAESSFSVPVGTLDSLHLASAILWRKNSQEQISFFTHDKELALAAVSQGFDTKGI